ncbi:calponin homology domain-containing protein DDB_G0272472-like [Strongylocentrotus purpuratus]|uniref:Uncharacterized protein n=1 Tax=Strongylocentrotus purpuratus TaxID=7668 RepID=A0A7M7HM71_STRPU|nr:calponin homology domain-containing protein DDB_G0272472-like [Strongylocentrotus purpuratus]|eukprot:XP_011670981.1 PREDICTED: calponin homology domain-containing protein DDB_G0272472-like [Strongylocentrotus purpuratus]
MPSDKDQLQWLDLLRGCLNEGKRTFATICTNLGCTCRMLYEKAKKDAKEAKEANQKIVTEVEERKQELKKRREEDRASSEKEKHLLAADVTKKLESKQQHVDTLMATVREKERNETTLTQQVEELKKVGEENRARAEKEKRSLAADVTKKLESKQQHVDTLMATVREKERNETTLTQQVEELKKVGEENRARAEKEKRSLAADVTKKLESKQQHVDTLMATVREKERNETTLTQQVEELKKVGEENRARAKKEKRSLAADVTKKLESKQQHVDTLMATVSEKERNETTQTQHVEKLKQVEEENRARAEKEKRSLAEDMTKKRESKQQHVDTLMATVRVKERNETTLTQQVEKLKQVEEENRARAEKEKRSLAEDMTNKLESRQQHVDTLMATVSEKERNETTLTQHVEKLKQVEEENRARAEKEKRSLAEDMTKKLESKQQHVDALTETVREKERNETTLTQQVEELRTGRDRDRGRFEKDKRSIELSWKKEHDYKEQLLEQLERETWKLRTKIQLESEIRSAEQKKKAETHQWSFIPWVTSGKQAQGGPSSPEDNSTGGLGTSDSIQAGEEPPDDEFAGILQQIADDLYDEAKIDSLGGQLGILQGDIQRALMTNMR